MRRAGVMLAVALRTTAAIGQIVDDQATRPPPIPPTPACELWEGTVSGNDPSVQVRARLCPQGARVTGLLQWSSLLSGWNLREIEGAWSPDRATLTMRDVRVAEERPRPGWRFCAVDHYDLRASGDGVLTGTYDALACQDHARVELHRTQRADEGGAPRLPSPPEHAPPVTPPRPSSGLRRRFGCATTPAGRAGGPRWAVGLALLALSLERRARTHRALTGFRAL